LSSEEQRPTGPNRKPQKTPAKSQKLNRTLRELESAFNDWESLGLPPPEGLVAQPTPPVATSSGSSSDEEFRKKTKKLLSQLREQLHELNEE
jgi:hypothetical protein